MELLQQTSIKSRSTSTERKCLHKQVSKVEALPQIMEARGSSGDLVEARRPFTIAQNLKHIFLMILEAKVVVCLSYL